LAQAQAQGPSAVSRQGSDQPPSLESAFPFRVISPSKMAASLAPAFNAMEKMTRGREAVAATPAGAASSRSTSVGSSPTQSSAQGSPVPIAADPFSECDGLTPSATPWQGLVDFGCPPMTAPFVGGHLLKADASAWRPSSLDDLFQAACRAPPGLAAPGLAPPGLAPPPGLELVRSPTAAAAELAVAVAAAALAGDEAEADEVIAPKSGLSAASPPWEPPAPVLRLAETLPQAAMGSPECPTAGSVNHFLGGCKPCAFVHTKGCGNGVLCPFCHLCQPGEKKRRQKATRSWLRSEAHLDRAV